MGRKHSGTRVIKDHWFRDGEGIEPHMPPSCGYKDCGSPQEEHVEAVGEWKDPRHIFWPDISWWPSCARCGRRWGHSTHFGSKKNRALWWDHWNGFWGVAWRRQ